MSGGGAPGSTAGRAVAPIAVIGLGNEWRRDDGAGPAAARRLRGRLPGSVEVMERAGEPLGLIEELSGRRCAFICDAVRSGAPAGTVHRLDAARRLPAFLAAPSTHALGLAETVELARALDRLPPTLIVFAVEGARFGNGRELTPSVRRGVGEAAERIEREAFAAAGRTGAAAEY